MGTLVTPVFTLGDSLVEMPANVGLTADMHPQKGHVDSLPISPTLMLLRLSLSALRFHQCRWLEHRADRAFWRCIELQVRADRIRETETAFVEGLGL